MSHPAIKEAWESVFPAPVITGFTPATGLVGAEVTISGAHFTGAMGVSFGGVPASSYTVDSDTQITVTVPLAALTGPIRVVTPAGTGAISAPFAVITDADLSVTATGPYSAVRGGQLTYTFAVTNQGPAEAAEVQIEATLPSGLSFVSNTGDCTTSFPCALGALASGQNRTVVTTLAVPVDFPPAAFQIQATASSTSPDPDSSDDTAAVTTRFGSFFTVTPCRVADTRDPTSPNGPPALAAGSDRTLVLAGICGIPAGATALAVNVTVTGPAAPGHLRLYPADIAIVPLASTINFTPGLTRANNAVVTASADGAVRVTVLNRSAGEVQLILDVTGYFE
jgi:uncharacterized repeat protein (TIGR01451 family)